MGAREKRRITLAVPAVFRKYNEISLIKRILVGLAIGIVLALLIPNVQPWTDIITLLGSLFVGALKAVAPVLVFFLVISALCNAQGAGTMKTVVVLYVISTLVAAIVALIGSEIFPTTLTLDTSSMVEQAAPEGIGEVLTTLLMNIVANPVDALMNANYVGILAWAVVLGVALRAAGERTKEVFTAISDAVSKAVRWVINLAPFGILGLVYASVSTSGLEIFTEYGHLILVLVACMLIIALVTNPLIVWICTRKNPYPLVLRCLKDSGLTAFFTRSSAANIPVNLELCRKLGLNKDNYSVSIPLGATINMAGAAVSTRWRVVRRPAAIRRPRAPKERRMASACAEAFTSTSLSTCAASAPQVLASSEKALSLMSVEAVSAAGAT